MLNCAWRSPPFDLALSSDEVHLWRIYLDQPRYRIWELQQILSSDEQQRAEQFHEERDRNRFIISRGGLRTILAAYLQKAPKHLEFAYGAYGKPSLTGIFADTPLQFNLSHSHTLTLCAVTYHREIGVDIEQIRPTERTNQFIQRFFSDQEAASLRSLPMPQRQIAFFHYWTGKEAYIKAVGSGVFRLAKQVEVAIAPETTQLVSIAGDPDIAKHWTLQAFTPAPGYAGALAIKGKLCTLKFWEFSGVA